MKASIVVNTIMLRHTVCLDLQDDEGRCYSDSFAELPELIERDKAPGDEDPPE